MWIKNEKLCVLFGEMLGVFLLKLLNTTCSINQFLFARKKRMAGRANLNLNGLVDGTKLNFVTAGASGRNLMVWGMNIRFHCTLNLQKTCSQHGDEYIYNQQFFSITRFNFFIKEKTYKFTKNFKKLDQRFIDAKNSSLDLVCPILSSRNSMASAGFMDERILRRIQIRFRSSGFRSKSSFRVPDF